MGRSSRSDRSVAGSSAGSEADSAAVSPPEGFEARLQFVRAGPRAVNGASKVYLNANDMARQRIDPGAGVALLQEATRELLLCGIAWPLDKVKRNGVGVSTMWESSLAQHKSARVQLLRQVPTLRTSPAAAVSLQVVSRASAGSKTSAVPSEKEQTLLARYVLAMLDGVLVHTDALLSLSVHGLPTVFRVYQADDNGTKAGKTTNVVFRVSSLTALSIKWTPAEQSEIVAPTPIDSRNTTSTAPLRGFASVGGLKAEIETIRQILEQPLVNPEVFKSYGLPPPKGLLLFGPPGTGKTMIARALASELKAEIFFINGPEVVSKYIGESEANLRRIFQQAARVGPSLIFIDEIDAICPKRDARVGDMEKRMVATLLTLMDGLEKNAQVVVLGATNRPNALDPAIRRPGRFDREVEISIPNATNRLEILQVLLSRIPHNVSDDQLQELSGTAHGYVGADLSALCKEAALCALQRAFAGRTPANPLQKSTSMPTFTVELADLKHAMRGIRPSALREIAIDVPRVLWSDIGGQHMIKQQLKEAVEWPLRHPEAFIRMGIRPPKGVLLYGPPGCSKTLTAKALATESSMNFIAIKGPELFSKWVGESEKAVQSIFRKARAAAPTVVFFDEIDAIASQRGGGDGGGGSQVADRVLSQLLTELDGIEPLKQVLVVAATNRPDLIDSALMRPGRIDRVLYVGPPDRQARMEILTVHCRKIPLGDDVDFGELADASERFSGAELYSLCREAAMAAIEDDRDAHVVSKRHFLRAISLIQPQIDDSMLQFFEDFRLRGKAK